jgi:transcriptional regulator with XRE-family HTH domain
MRRRPFDPKLRQTLGQLIRQRREKLGWTQRDLRKAADLSSQRQVWGIEHGLTGLTIDTASRVAHALGWSLSKLFKGL